MTRLSPRHILWLLPPSLPPLSVRKLNGRRKGRLRKRDNLLMKEGGSWSSFSKCLSKFTIFFLFHKVWLLPSYLSFSYPLTTNFFLSHTNPPAILPFMLWSSNYHLFPFLQWLLPSYLSCCDPLTITFFLSHSDSCHPTFHVVIP